MHVFNILNQNLINFFSMKGDSIVDSECYNVGQSSTTSTTSKPMPLTENTSDVFTTRNNTILLIKTTTPLDLPICSDAQHAQLSLS